MYLECHSLAILYTKVKGEKRQGPVHDSRLNSVKELCKVIKILCETLVVNYLKKQDFSLFIETKLHEGLSMASNNN